MSSELIKPCPHCGGTACLTANYSEKIHRYFLFVKCDICGAQGRTFCTAISAGLPGWKENACTDAVKAWNMRTADNEAPEAAEECNHA